mgnify:CR=1 FL=1
MNTESNIKNTASTFGLLGKIVSHLDAKRKKQLIFLFILSIFASLAESISIAMLIPFIGFFINPELYEFNNFFKTVFEFFKINNNKEILATVTSSFALIVILSGYIKLKFIKISNVTTEYITSDFRIKIFKFLINQDFSYYFKYGSNEILSNMSQKIGSFTTILISSLNILNSILIISCITSVLVFNEPFYTPIIVFCIGLFFLIIYKIKVNSILAKGQKISVNQNLIIDIFENTIGYLPEIIIYNLKNFYTSILTKTSQKTAQYTSEIRTIGQTPRILLEVFVIIFVLIFIYFSGFAERSTEVNISYLAILAFGAQKSLPLINSIYLYSVNFKGATPNVVGFLNILDSGQNKIFENYNYETLDFNKSILLKDISYCYDKGQPNILNSISLEINRGDKIAIKGETGSGKSTLANIISGLLKPTKGKILIDGVEITKQNETNWQKNISIVPQSIFLNDASISENIAIAENLNEIDIDKVKKSAKLAYIDRFIENLPNKYNEEVGERGVRLSGGQRQRIGIARALYRNSKLIILDEPTNALDAETENLLMNSITNLKGDITVIMISHNNSSLSFFDKIIDLNNFK